MSKLDVLFTDYTAYKPYNGDTLRREPLGGTEASVVRVAEGLAKAGLKVGVMQHCYPAVDMIGGVFYLPLETKTTPRNLIMLRGIHNVKQFPQSTKFSWMHDLPDAKLLQMRKGFIDNDITVVGVSRWHKHNIKELICDVRETTNPKVKYVYNPVPDGLFIDKKTTVKYNRNKLVWLSSPHKGLTKALDLFSRLQNIISNDLELHVYNPGYFAHNLENIKGVVIHEPKPCQQMWTEIMDALCVFYPCQFKETFGLIAAEANALHVPVATYQLAALSETVATSRELLPYNAETELLKRVESWYNGYRPEVFGQDRFKTSEVVAHWMQLLK